jgi:hypothetical protein
MLQLEHGHQTCFSGTTQSGSNSFSFGCVEALFPLRGFIGQVSVSFYTYMQFSLFLFLVSFLSFTQRRTSAKYVAVPMFADP